MLFGLTPTPTTEVMVYQAPEPVVEQVATTTSLTHEDEKVEHEEEEVADYVACSCVKTAKIKYGVNIPPAHNAWDLSPNSDVPVVGQLVLMQYPTIGHVAVLEAITDDGYLISEGNYKSCQYTTRVIPKDYYALLGFWTEENYYNPVTVATTSTTTLAK